MRQLVAGGAGAWLLTKLKLLTDYVDGVGGWGNVDWYLVISTGLLLGIDGLIAVGALKTPPEAVNKPAKPIQKTEPVPDFDAFDETYMALPEGFVIDSTYFTQEELECRGMTCNCAYSGMSARTMAIVDDLRKQFGPLICTSGYRCPEHNATIPGTSKGSYHVKARAIDVKPAKGNTATPEQLYQYLDSKYPRMFGLGLYNTFIHIDDRDDSWARKTGPDSQWKAFSHATADVDLAPA